MRFLSPIAVLFVALLAVVSGGCGSKTHPKADLDKAQAAVVASMDNWKANEPIAKLKTQNPAVDFNEELRATQTLTEYTVVKVHATDPEIIRVVVTLKLKDRKGKVTEREAVYAVAFKSMITVSRDPYF
ncbi:MAG: hypothetical protein U0798_02905 [Gemmataceae bacterium]